MDKFQFADIFLTDFLRTGSGNGYANRFLVLRVNCLFTNVLINRIVKGREQIVVNKGFVKMMDELGYDIEITYMRKAEG